MCRIRPQRLRHRWLYFACCRANRFLVANGRWIRTAVLKLDWNDREGRRANENQSRVHRHRDRHQLDTVECRCLIDLVRCCEAPIIHLQWDFLSDRSEILAARSADGRRMHRHWWKKTVPSTKVMKWKTSEKHGQGDSDGQDTSPISISDGGDQYLK